MTTHASAGHRQPPAALGGSVGLAAALLLGAVRGVAVELASAMDAGGVREHVGPVEVRWSQPLWDPWFALGGVSFLLTAVRRRAGR